MKSLKFISLLSLVFLGSSPLSNADAKKPFHFAHRGGAHEYEENTLFAFKSCYDKGIRGYELDVRMTKDGELVVRHDDTLNRTHKGNGPVEHLTADEAKVIRSKKQDEPLLFVSTLLDYLKDKPGMYVEFEMKTSNKTLYPNSSIKKFVAKLHQAVTAFVPESSTYIFTSFDQRPLKAIKQIDPNADIMLVKGGPLTPEVMEAAKAIGSKRIGAMMEGTTRAAVKEAQKQGFIVTGWLAGNTKHDSQ